MAFSPLFLVSKYFWLLAILGTGINWVLFRKRAHRHIAHAPDLKVGYEKLLRGYLFFMNIPWVVMGLGVTLGGVPSVWHYFKPRDGNPYVLAYFATIFCLWGINTFWLFFRGGAETLAKHPGIIIVSTGFNKKELTNPAHIKLFWLLAMTGGIFGVVMMLTLFADFPMPNIDSWK